MENAADAIKMAAAVLIFVGALAIAIIMIGQARATSDAVLSYTDATNYYTYVESSGADVTQNGNRIVGLDTVISTLYRYYKEGFKVEFIDQSNQPIVIYEIKNVVYNPPEDNTEYWEWVNKYTDDSPTIVNNRLTLNLKINYFDLEDETSRNKINAPWTAGNIDGSSLKDKQYTLVRKNLEKFITEDVNWSGNNPNLNIYGINSSYFANFNKNLLEMLTNYNMDGFEEILSEELIQDNSNSNKSKRTITYKLYKNP